MCLDIISFNSCVFMGPSPLECDLPVFKLDLPLVLLGSSISPLECDLPVSIVDLPVVLMDYSRSPLECTLPDHCGRTSGALGLLKKIQLECVSPVFIRVLPLCE